MPLPGIRRPQSLDVLVQTRHTVHDSPARLGQPSTSWSCACATTATSGMGSSGSGQVTKLLNNAMTMSNLDNAVDLIRLISRLGMDVQAVIDVIGLSSGGSAILHALDSDVTPGIAPHIQGLMRKDIEHFADAIRAYGLDPQPLHDRGLAGVSGLAEAVGLLAAGAGR
jgi:NAD-binding of NADP-dependent 3-hydroxyisobutyrate dehydrogenase